MLGWEGISAGAHAGHNPGFSPGAWTEIAGPIMGNSWTITTPPGNPAGYPATAVLLPGRSRFATPADS